MRPPNQRYQLVRGASSKHKVQYYRTQEARDIAGQRWADKDGETVMGMLWDEEHPQDELNQGWAHDMVWHPAGQEPTPEPGTRTSAAKVQPGQQVQVFGLRSDDDGQSDGEFHSGVVEKVEHAERRFYSTVVHFIDGRTVHARDYAVSYVLSDA